MGEEDKSPIIIKYFNITFSVTDRKSRKKTSKIVKG